MPPKIAVVGTSGSGKTTVARELARRLGVLHVELDALFHGPGWTETPVEEFRRRVVAATEGSGWVMDGNYESSLGDLVLERADTVVWLDLPLPVALSRVTRRTIGRIRTREELWSGNRESWRGGFFGWEPDVRLDDSDPRPPSPAASAAAREASPPTRRPAAIQPEG